MPSARLRLDIPPSSPTCILWWLSKIRVYNYILACIIGNYITPEFIIVLWIFELTWNHLFDCNVSSSTVIFKTYRPLKTLKKYEKLGNSEMIELWLLQLFSRRIITNNFICKIFIHTVTPSNDVLSKASINNFSQFSSLKNKFVVNYRLFLFGIITQFMTLEYHSLENKSYL